MVFHDSSSSVLRTFPLFSLSCLLHIVFATSFSHRKDLTLAFNHSSAAFQATPTSSVSCTYEFIRNLDMQWHQTATPLTVGHVMVIVSDDVHNPKFSTSYYSDIVEDGTTMAHASQFLVNGTLRQAASSQSHTNAAGTVTAVVTMLNGTSKTFTYPTPVFDVASDLSWEGTLVMTSTTLTGNTLRPLPVHIALPTVTAPVDPKDPAGLTYKLSDMHPFHEFAQNQSWILDHVNGSSGNLVRLVYEYCSELESLLFPNGHHAGEAVFAAGEQRLLPSTYVLATTTVHVSASASTVQSYIAPSENQATTFKQASTTFTDPYRHPTTTIATTTKGSQQLSSSKPHTLSEVNANSESSLARHSASSDNSLDPDRLRQTSLKLGADTARVSGTPDRFHGHGLADFVLSFIESSPKASDTLRTTGVNGPFAAEIGTDTGSKKEVGTQVPQKTAIQLLSTGISKIASSAVIISTDIGSSTRKSTIATAQDVGSKDLERSQNPFSSGTTGTLETTSPASGKLSIATSGTSVIEAAITVGSSIVTANSDSVYVLGTQTLSPGGYAVTVSGETLSLASDASILVIDGTSESVYTSNNNGGVGGYIWSGVHGSGSATPSQAEYHSTLGVNGTGNATGTASDPAGFPGEAVSQRSLRVFAFAIAPSLLSIFSMSF